MNEKPILFSGSMVRAILNGNKTQTRRVMKPQPDRIIDGMPLYCGDKANKLPHCPYGKTGDTLWVRETWRVGAWHELVPKICIDYRADGHVDTVWRNCTVEQWLKFKQESIDDAIEDGYDRRHAPTRWRPSILMFRWASRITLKVKSVRIERLNDISDEDAAAEGLESVPHDGHDRPYYRNDRWPKGLAHSSPRFVFSGLWESINGQGSWDKNPWVWVVDFEKVEA